MTDRSDVTSAPATAPTTQASAEPRPGWPTLVVPLLGWVALVWVAVVRGEGLRHVAHVNAIPLYGQVGRHLTPWTAVVAAFGVVLVVALPRWAARLGWRRLLVVAALATIAWGGAVASLRGPARIEGSQRSRFEYPAVVPQVDQLGVGPFVRTFTETEALRRYPIHVQGHPVGIALVYVGLDRVGLGGAGGAAAVLLLAGGATVAAVLLVVRDVAGDERARAAVPFLVLAPAVVWTVTSADALFAAVGAAATALLVRASSTADGRARLGLAAAGGAAFGLGLHLSYGLAPLALVPVTVVVARRRWSVLVGAAVGGLLVVGVFVLAGFWWFDGLQATHERYLAGVSSKRPFRFFTFVSNPAGFALALGPAAAVAVAKVRDRRLWLLAGAALFAVAVADASGLSKGEVERIWLPYVPWVLALAAGLIPSARPLPPGDRPNWPRPVTALLAAQAATAVVVESTVRTFW